MNIPRTTWLPVVTASTMGDLTVAYTAQRGVWAQSDGLIIVGCDVRFTPTYTTAGGSIQITGWPPSAIPPETTNLWSGTMRNYAGGAWPAGVTQIFPGFSPPPFSTIGIFGLNGTTGSLSALPMTGFASGTPAQLQFSLYAVVGP